ncbi:hypothetical protein [Niveibacterium sp. SC-1]|uniref:hypothetical protein n=1 Tax=Niveibacterium sp. SC-1 TaxID=3135646 RepID=UPI00311E58A9
MAEGGTTKSTDLVDALTKVVTLISLALAAFATWKALPADAEIKHLQAETQRLDLALKQADADLRNLESSRKLTLELYQEVRQVIQKKDKDPREEDAVRVLVESLADDPFRWKLLRVIAIGAQDSYVKESAAATSRFYEEEAVVQTRPGQVASATAAPETAQAPGGFGSYNVDLFFCQKKKASSEPLARAALELKEKGASGRWRVRELPDSINQQPGYGVWNSEVRFTPPDERPVANWLAQAFAAKGVKLGLHETSYPTPGYVSVFICQ